MYKLLKGWLSGSKAARQVSAHQVTLIGRDVSYAAPANVTILRAAVQAGVPFPHNCGEGFCGSCRCKVVSGRYALSGDIAHLVSHDDQSRGHTLACRTRALSDVTVSFETAVSEVQASVVSLTRMAAHVVRLRLQLQAPLTYQNGQFFNLRAAQLSARPYSVVTPAGRGSAELEFDVSTRGGGAFATWVSSQAKVGDPVWLDGPHGQFLLPADAKHVVLISSGSGAGVLWGMVSERPALEVSVLAVPDRTGHFYLRSAFEEMAKQQRVQLQEVEFDAQSESGYANLTHQAVSLASAHLSHGLRPVFLICGSEALVKSARSALVAAGVSADRVLSDVFVGRQAVLHHMAPASA